MRKSKKIFAILLCGLLSLLLFAFPVMAEDEEITGFTNIRLDLLPDELEPKDVPAYSEVMVLGIDYDNDEFGIGLLEFLETQGYTRESLNNYQAYWQAVKLGYISDGDVMKKSVIENAMADEMITVTCPECGETFTVSVSAAGQSGTSAGTSQEEMEEAERIRALAEHVDSTRTVSVIIVIVAFVIFAIAAVIWLKKVWNKETTKGFKKAEYVAGFPMGAGGPPPGMKIPPKDADK